VKRLLLLLSCVLVISTFIWKVQLNSGEDSGEEVKFEYFAELPQDMQKKIFLEKIFLQNNIDDVIDLVNLLLSTNRAFNDLIMSEDLVFINITLEHCCNVFIADAKDIIKDKVVSRHEGNPSSAEMVVIFNEYNIQKNEFLDTLMFLAQKLHNPFVPLYATIMADVLDGDANALENFLNNCPFIAQFFYFDLTLNLTQAYFAQNYTVTFDRSVIQVLKNYGVDIARPLVNKFSLLMLAAMHNLVDVADYLIEQGINVQQESLQNWSAINYAASIGSTEMVQLLLGAGANINHQDNNFEMTPLNTAVAQGHLDLAIMLVNYGANIFIANNSGMTPLLFACQEEAISTNFIRLLLENGAEVNAQNNRLDSPLILAVRNNRNNNVIFLLIQYGAEVNLQNFGGMTAFMFAVDHSNIGMVILLLQNGADHSLSTNEGVTALMLAAAHNNINMVTLLLHNGADHSLPTNEGMTALLFAVNNNNIDMVTLLLQSGADHSLSTNEGMTALMVAVAHNNINMVNLLLQNGADTSLQTNQGQTALDLANDYGFGEIAAILQQAEANVMQPLEEANQ